ncbi:Ubiquinol-cytochrome C reductase iron-sulfur subunit [hydrothermal vent metagenome]|uniref:Ubiquinol-cytochrome c reductase iron-sulfur subunit n=1 Tax=hydrothermal vent metagenome TaxID=652676 RepID=A0A3B0TDK1_9ZZZZ
MGPGEQRPEWGQTSNGPLRGPRGLPLAHSDTVDETRRDFLFVATGAMAVVGVGAVAWPLIDQMNPDASVLSLSSIEVDFEAVEVGQAITVMWRGKPVFIRHRTAEEIKVAEETPLDVLPDPETDMARIERPEWLVVIGICTHLGCIPKGQSIGDERGEYGGWFCPCHGSHYDTAGRIRKGPAPKNLYLPPYAFLTDTSIKIG